MKAQTINKAYQALIKRINKATAFEYAADFWNAAHPGFNKDGDKVILCLIYKSTTSYGASICDKNEKNPIICVLNKSDSEKVSKFLKSGFATMRQLKEFPNLEFKRLWLNTAISSNQDLYKLGHAGTPFIKAGDTIESLAIEYDMLKA